MTIFNRAVSLAVAVTLLLAGGCGDDTPTTTTGQLGCSAGAAPLFLSSKLDDDDGDGNPFDEDYPVIDDEDDDIADHAWVRDDKGLLHLYFQTENHGQGSYIEHYTTSDLRSLDYVGVALDKNPIGWDSHGVWAPHIVRVGGTYYMFYTGTEGLGPDSKQRIGLAVSTDLTVWTRHPANNCAGAVGDGCIYDCDEEWTTWGDAPGSFNQQCRDPFVTWDSTMRRWVMFAASKSDNQYGVVTVSYSADLIGWTGAGFINATRRLPTGEKGLASGGQAENPFVMSRDDTHYLLFTDWQDPEEPFDAPSPRTMVQYATSTSLTADPSGSIEWTYRGYTPDPGVNAIEAQKLGGRWIMSQSIANDRCGDYDHRRELRLKCVVWGQDYEFTTENVTITGGSPEGQNPVGPQD